MIFDKFNVNFSDDDWIEIIKKYLDGWTEIPLNSNQGYNKEELKFYDGLLGTLLIDTENLIKYNYPCINKKFVNSWKYQGKLYRIIHPCYLYEEDNILNPKLIMPKVDYHGMISHWTDDYTFSGLMYKLNYDEKYLILEVDTKEHLAFNVNKFRKKYHCRKISTEKEREFIYPMLKENTIEHYMSVKEFINVKKGEK